MQRMVLADEIDALVAERVWQESEKALREAAPGAFFRVLREMRRSATHSIRSSTRCSALPQPARWHPEIDAGVHTFMVLDQAAILSGECQGAIRGADA